MCCGSLRSGAAGLSQAAIDHAQEKGVPLFVVDLTHWPQPHRKTTHGRRSRARTTSSLGRISLEDFIRPSPSHIARSASARRSEWGPDDHNWSKLCVYVSPWSGRFAPTKGVPDCEEEVLHECGGIVVALIQPICSSTALTTSRCTRIRFTGLTAHTPSPPRGQALLDLRISHRRPAGSVGRAGLRVVHGGPSAGDAHQELLAARGCRGVVFVPDSTRRPVGAGSAAIRGPCA